jgi:hypothetical protein
MDQSRKALDNPTEIAYCLREVVPRIHIHMKAERNQERILCVWFSISIRLHYKLLDFVGVKFMNDFQMLQCARRSFKCHCLASFLKWCLHSFF